jgi:hypothetical protein
MCSSVVLLDKLLVHCQGAKVQVCQGPEAQFYILRKWLVLKKTKDRAILILYVL